VSTDTDRATEATEATMPTSALNPETAKAWNNKNLGIIADKHQINVAITRARKGLVIIG